MRKVLYIAHEDTKGGATHSLLNILDNLPDDVHPYVLIPKTLGIRQRLMKANKALFHAGTLQEELDERRIPYFRAFYLYDNINLQMNVFKRMFLSVVRQRELERIENLIRTEQIDIIHTNSSVVKFGADLSIKCQVKHIWHVREDVKEMFEFGSENLCKYYSNILNNSDKIVFVSENLKQSFEDSSSMVINKNKLRTIYNGIPLPNISKQSIIKESNQQMVNIYCFGTVYKIKGQEDLIELARRMRQENKNNFKIKIVGMKKKRLL